MDENFEHFVEIIKKSNNIVFFGGAGTSTNSGIKDFRGKDGIYNTKFHGYNPEEILHIDFFMNNRKIFNQFLQEKMNFKNYKPNKGHFALKKLEEMGKLKAIITQNIDELHQKAGSKNVVELHGTISHFICLSCGEKKDELFSCECGGIVRPPVTLYGEMLNEDVVNKAIKYIENAETLIVAGTSLVVYPAAYYLNYFKGKYLIIINESETTYDQRATVVLRGDFEKTFDDLVKYI